MNRSVFLWCLILISREAAAQTHRGSAGSKLGSETIGAISTFFDYDRGIPLQVRVVDSTRTSRFRRDKIVFTGSEGQRVPGYLAVPTSRTGKAPIVLLIHAGASSKETWWREDGFERGALVSERLVSSGFAVLAIDAQFHGERASTNDFEPFPSMWFQRQWFSWIRAGIIETVKDYRRLLDYLGQHSDVDTTRIGVLGYSIGGIMALHLTAFDARIQTTVAGVAGIEEAWLYPVAPVNIAEALGRVPVLLIGGRTDELATEQKMKRLADAIPGTAKRLLMFESGHRLPVSYADSVVAWFGARLR